jgi:hypothetical protein
MENNSLYTPLQFWFNSHPGLALPMFAVGSQTPFNFRYIYQNPNFSIMRDYKNLKIHFSSCENDDYSPSTIELQLYEIINDLSKPLQHL